MRSKSQIRALLKEATDPVHQRLHNHAGLGAIATGTISKSDYRNLLVRLYGFHKPFDELILRVGPALGCALEMNDRQRAGHILQDLQTLGLTERQLSAIPCCDTLFQPVSLGELMGALYVVEGSTLGGLHLARALSPLFGPDGTAGRRFFFGYGDMHSARWQEFLLELDACADDRQQEKEIVNGAMSTFDNFEVWMKGWRTEATGPAAVRDVSELLTAR